MVLIFLLSFKLLFFFFIYTPFFLNIHTYIHKFMMFKYSFQIVTYIFFYISFFFFKYKFKIFFNSTLRLHTQQVACCHGGVGFEFTSPFTGDNSLLFASVALLLGPRVIFQLVLFYFSFCILLWSISWDLPVKFLQRTLRRKKLYIVTLDHGRTRLRPGGAKLVALCP